MFYKTQELEKYNKDQKEIQNTEIEIEKRKNNLIAKLAAIEQKENALSIIFSNSAIQAQIKKIKESILTGNQVIVQQYNEIIETRNTIAEQLKELICQ